MTILTAWIDLYDPVYVNYNTQYVEFELFFNGFKNVGLR